MHRLYLVAVDFRDVSKVNHVLLTFFLRGWPVSNRLACRWGIGDRQQPYAPAYKPAASESNAAGRPGAKSRPFTFVLGESDKAFLRSCSGRTLSASVAVMQGTTWLGAARSFTVLVALGEALPYGTLSPCWCRKHLKKCTSFHDAYATTGADGVRPRSRWFCTRKHPAPYKSSPAFAGGAAYVFRPGRCFVSAASFFS